MLRSKEDKSDPDRVGEKDVSRSSTVAECGLDLLVQVVLALVGRFEVLGGHFLRALGVVLGTLSEVVLIDGALPLAGDVVDPAHMDVGPD